MSLPLKLKSGDRAPRERRPRRRPARQRPDAIPLMVELCAGTAALSLRLEDARARPPVSRMGSKAGYADAILRRIGLQPGQGARRYLWCDPDPGVRLLLHAYADRALALAAADIIRGWADEEPRALWERLRAEGPVKGPEPREVARWAMLESGNRLTPLHYSEKHGEIRTVGRYPGDERTTCYTDLWSTPAAKVADRLALPDTPAAILPTADIDPREVARWLRIVSSNRLVPLGPAWENTGQGGATFGGAGFCDPAEKVADGTAALPQMPAAVVAGEIDPREVARWATVHGWSYAGTGMLDPAKCGIGNVDSKGRCWGVSDQAWIATRLDALPDCPALIFPTAEVDPRDVARWAWVQGHGDASKPPRLAAPYRNPEGNADGSWKAPPRDWLARRLATLPHLGAGAACAPPAWAGPWDVTPGGVLHRLPAGTVAYIDSPYFGTTGYADDIPRPEGDPYGWVRDTALRWAEAGATVVVSEAVPIPGLADLPGWYAHEITAERVGQKRTFSRQKREWLTMNRPPMGQRRMW